jgi:hypothetical protein
MDLKGCIEMSFNCGKNSKIVGNIESCCYGSVDCRLRRSRIGMIEGSFNCNANICRSVRQITTIVFATCGMETVTSLSDLSIRSEANPTEFEFAFLALKY